MDGTAPDHLEDDISGLLSEHAKDIALLLRALAHRKRLHVLTLLATEPQTFRALQKATGLHKTALSHHLGLLVKAGVVNHTGRGHYELDPDGRALLNALTSTYSASRRKRELEAARRANYIQRIHTKEGYIMKELKVEIVKLAPMRVASVRVFSETPERDAWEKMRAWAEPRGFLEDLRKHPVFGFNSPDPSPGQKGYGYEFWMRVGPDVQPEGEVEVKDVEGGLYAVTTCNLGEELESEFFKKEGYLESWKKIGEWVRSSTYSVGSHQCLEKAHDPGASEEELILDLYFPIKE